MLLIVALHGLLAVGFMVIQTFYWCLSTFSNWNCAVESVRCRCMFLKLNCINGWWWNCIFVLVACCTADWHPLLWWKLLQNIYFAFNSFSLWCLRCWKHYYIWISVCVVKAEDMVISRVPCTRVLSQEIQIFQEMSFCVLQVLLHHFTNTLWKLYIDFCTIRIVFESSFQFCIFKVANLKKLWQFWQKCVDRTFVHVEHGAV